MFPDRLLEKSGDSFHGTPLARVKLFVSFASICVAKDGSSCKPFASRALCVTLWQQRKGMLCDHQLLVSRYDQEDDAAVRSRNQRFAIRIGRRIKNGTKPPQLLHDASADHW